MVRDVLNFVVIPVSKIDCRNIDITNEKQVARINKWESKFGIQINKELICLEWGNRSTEAIPIISGDQLQGIANSDGVFTFLGAHKTWINRQILDSRTTKPSSSRLWNRYFLVPSTVLFYVLLFICVAILIKTASENGKEAKSSLTELFSFRNLVFNAKSDDTNSVSETLPK